MATVYSTEQTTLNGPAFGNGPATRVKANKQGGRIRFFEAQYTVPASPPAIADKIVWGKLPVKARVIGHLSQLNWGTGNASSSTLNLGDNVSAARHLAATAVTTAGTATPRRSRPTAPRSKPRTTPPTPATLRVHDRRLHADLGGGRRCAAGRPGHHPARGLRDRLIAQAVSTGPVAVTGAGPFLLRGC
jgi:hypothetical protein